MLARIMISTLLPTLAMSQTIDVPMAHQLADNLNGPKLTEILVHRDEFASEWSERLLHSLGRSDAALSLVRCATDNALNVDQLGVVRQIGSHLQPDFADVVLKALERDQRAFAKGRLISLLRRTPLEQVTALGSHLSDRREGEELSKRSIGNGATPFRVCDIAFNVLQELRKTEGNTPPSLVRSMSFEDRDLFITEAYGQQSSSNDAAKQTAPAPKQLPVVQPPAPKKAPEAKPTVPTPGEKPTSSTPWSIIAVMIVAAIGLLWLLLKRRS